MRHVASALAFDSAYGFDFLIERRMFRARRKVPCHEERFDAGRIWLGAVVALVALVVTFEASPARAADSEPNSPTQPSLAPDKRAAPSPAPPEVPSPVTPSRQS